MENRYNNIDYFRFIACFFILLVHTKYGALNEDAVFALRLSARWAVPFFFICSGFFLEKKIVGNRDLYLESIGKTLKKLISILIIASIIYIPINFYLGYYKYGIDTLLIGTFIHLWFIGSLLFGNIFIWYMYLIRKEKHLIITSLLILLIALVSDSYDNFFGRNLSYDAPRFLLSIPFMVIGMLIYRFQNKLTKRISNWALVLIAVLGFTFQYAETYFFHQKFNYSKNVHELLIGTILFITPLFILIIKNKTKFRDSAFSRIGRKYSLWIYLYHPAMYVFINFLNNIIFNNDSIIYSRIQMFNPIICFSLCLVLANFLDKNLNKVYNYTNGIF